MRHPVAVFHFLKKSTYVRNGNCSVIKSAFFRAEGGTVTPVSDSRVVEEVYIYKNGPARRAFADFRRFIRRAEDGTKKKTRQTKISSPHVIIYTIFFPLIVISIIINIIRMYRRYARNSASRTPGEARNFELSGGDDGRRWEGEK